ncbi:hypothetical protein A0123_03443 [Gluconobacter cerinus]|uniref:Uncharacterized protein n=1 Tax=Gluconobacter cerinus TaxID=38307 RepID=A0A1B6VFA3_9PROT|nr:hypothetical protein A0123_03443 [Gluconobacter cerinus]
MPEASATARPVSRRIRWKQDRENGDEVCFIHELTALPFGKARIIAGVEILHAPDTDVRIVVGQPVSVTEEGRADAVFEGHHQCGVVLPRHLVRCAGPVGALFGDLAQTILRAGECEDCCDGSSHGKHPFLFSDASLRGADGWTGQWRALQGAGRVRPNHCGGQTACGGLCSYPTCRCVV